MTSYGPNNTVPSGPFRTQIRNSLGAPEVPAAASGTQSGEPGAEPVRIRKYPNRRLYDTSRSRHLTHEGVVDLVRQGRSVHVTDSRSGADITNVVLLQILIEREPAKLAALPSALLHRAMRVSPAEIYDAAAEAMGASRRSAEPATARLSAAPNGERTERTDRAAPPPTSRTTSPLPPNGVHRTGESSRPKALAKRAKPATPDDQLS